MSGASVHALFERYTCKMARGEMVLLMEVRIATLYKLMRSTITVRCNNTIVLDNETNRTPTLLVGKAMFWHQRKSHVGENDLHALHSKGMVESILDYSLDFEILEYCVYGKQN
jgi:hypothetical protein